MNRRKLTLLLLLFFLALAIPTTVLVYQAYGQLKWEAFHQQQQLARELNLRIDSGFDALIRREEDRPFSDYEFLNVSGSDGNNFVQPSPLSQFPLNDEIPGLLGYFQVDAAGQLRTPTVPRSDAAQYGISAIELQSRLQQEENIRGILGKNRLVGKSDLPAAEVVMEAEIVEEVAPSSSLMFESDSVSSVASSAPMEKGIAQGQAAFDELVVARSKSKLDKRRDLDQVKDLQLEDRYQIAAQAEAVEADARKKSEQKRSRKEQVVLPDRLPESSLALDRFSANKESEDGEVADDEAGTSIATPDFKLGAKQSAIRIETFESEIEPMKFSLLDSGHFVLFRRVWYDDQRFVQGLLIDTDALIANLISPAFRQSSLSSVSRLIVAYQGSILQNLESAYDRQYRADVATQENELLYQSRLIAPFGDIELIYTLARLPVGAGGQIIIWSAIVLSIVLIGGFFMLYRSGLQQLALSQQQQDFVSAVSHELKTPLTSIRMYGEMLREGWADPKKVKSYYDFIFYEAERLTRLINNVLQLARLSRNEQSGNPGLVSVDAALAELRPRLQSQLEASGFELSIEGEAAAESVRINIDVDWFIQVFINLVDNAIKFSANAEQKRIEIRYRLLQDGMLQFSLRDFGPGIAADQLKKIFKLFYRSDNELTRETVGTGIGLALVQQLMVEMQGKIDLVNCDPGVEVHLCFKAKIG